MFCFQASAIFNAWANLPLSDAEYAAKLAALQREHFPSAKPLPGVPELLSTLSRAPGVHVALATSSHSTNFKLKTSHLPPNLFAVFAPQLRVLGDDPRIPPGRGKPAPDIYALALACINASLPAGEVPVREAECLVFEDSVPGVEAGRRAGMRVVWVPHPGLREEYRGKEGEVLAGRASHGSTESEQAAGGKPGEVGDGWGTQLDTLENFPYARYGIDVDGKTEA